MLTKNRSALKRLKKDYEAFLKSDSVKYIDIKIAEDDLFNWYFVFKNLDKPYKDGEYLGNIHFPNDYPFKAPVLKFITPSGRFETNVAICTTFTHYHQNEWTPEWTIDSLLVGTISFMYEDGKGIGSILRSEDERMFYALKSVEFNKNNAIYRKYYLD